MAWGGNHFTPLLHVYETVGGYAPWQANLLLGMYVFGLIPGLLIAAALSDRYGRRPVLAIGVGSAAAASLVLAAATENFIVLCAGRVLAGIAVGVAMSVGSSWIKELSPAKGARRSALTLTLGFAVGAGVTGMLAQWAPAPTHLPFLVHAVLCIPALTLALRAPETVTRTTRSVAPWWHDLRVPAAGHRIFRWVVIPAAPWVFAAAGVAYAILPSAVESQLGDLNTLFATALTVATLGIGAVMQAAVPAIDRATHGRSLQVGLAGMTIGMLLASLAAWLRSPVLVILVAAVLGASYGVCVVAGLVIAQSLATPSDLAGVTGRYYALTYIGFLLPTVLAAVHPVLEYPASLGVVAGLCLLSLAIVSIGKLRST
ncbi:MFS transporter [Leucobacter luti]|nr:MFS transporter [Leucobacter luti]